MSTRFGGLISEESSRKRVISKESHLKRECLPKSHTPKAGKVKELVSSFKTKRDSSLKFLFFSLFLFVKRRFTREEETALIRKARTYSQIQMPPPLILADSITISGTFARKNVCV